MKLKRMNVLTLGIFSGCVIMAALVCWRLMSPGRDGACSSELIVGTASGYAPFVSLNMQGEYEGFDVDIAMQVAQRLGKKLVLKDLGSMVPLLLALRQGAIDCAIWAIEINERRQQEMTMIQYQGGGVRSYPLVFWGQIPAGITCLDDIKKYPSAVVCVEPGSSQEQFINAVQEIEKKSLEKVTDIILDLRYGKSLAAILDPALMDDLCAKNPELRMIEIPLPPAFQSFGNGICVARENSALSAQIARAIAAMKADGTISRLEQKWRVKG